MPGVSLEGICKYYPASGTVANDGACLEVKNLEIHAVVGENGAGKTTLMKILYGLERPDSGHIVIDGVDVALSGPAAATSCGVGMVQQHAEVVGEFSVAENVTLCAEPRRLGLFLDRKRAEAEVTALIKANGFRLDPAARASTLSVGELQQLEILKLLWRKASLLILDEPTALLADQEVDHLFDTLRRLRTDGKTIIMITHKVADVKRIADRVTVMRRGRTVTSLAVADVSESDLASLMMDKDAVVSRARLRAVPGEAGPIVFGMRGVSLARRRSSRPAVQNLDLVVRAGEVYGVCGLAGNGLSELEDLASGSVRPTKGLVYLEGHPLHRRRGPDRGYVPSDRLRRGSSLYSAVSENLVALDRETFFPRGLADRRRMGRFADDSIADFGIAARPGQRLGTLSGGSIQKVVLARELSGLVGKAGRGAAHKASFLLFCNPTHGLDLASSAFVHERLLEARERGAAILLVSSDLDEILALSDRMGIMSRGRLVLETGRDGGLDRAALEEAMLGIGEARVEGA